jgi:hypothetical protein
MTTRAERIHQKETYAAKQAAIAKSHNFPAPVSKTHTSTSSTTCGDSNCVMCGNPRKHLGELTIQEKRMYQKAIDEDI